jgi:hypothetical protein
MNWGVKLSEQVAMKYFTQRMDGVLVETCWVLDEEVPLRRNKLQFEIDFVLSS